MTAERRVRRARLALSAAVLLAAVGWAVTVAGGLILLVGVADLTVGLSRGLRQGLGVASLLLGAVVALAALWRNRDCTSLPAVALWLEERAPSMRYALVTLIEGRHPAEASKLEEIVAATGWERPFRQRLLRALAPPVLTGALILAALAALPRAVFERISAPAPGDVFRQPVPGPEADDLLRPIVVTLTPPTYSRLEPQTLEDPESIAGLAGTRITVTGRGQATSITATFGSRAIRPDGTGDRWEVGFGLPDSASVLRLAAGTHTRLLVVEGRPDSLPVVRLVAPARDTVWQASGGALPLRAMVHDDYGLAEGWFEYVVSTGAGERFTFRTGIVGRRTFDGVRDGSLDATLPLDALHLLPGEVMHLRAVARDRNVVTGPGTGFSDTRTVRVPSRGEGDSVSVYAAAPADADSSLLSERMLIMLTEALEARRPGLGREVVLRESRAIGRDQAALRRQVASVIFQRFGGEASAEESADEARGALSPDELLAAAERATEQNGEALDFAEDETPVVAVSRPLLEAYNAMWAAGRELDQGQPGRALPPMREALAAILRARAAERIYLRGRPPVAVVDLARVRLTGALTDVRPAPASAEPFDATTAAALLARFTRAVGALPDAAATDSLALLRIDALRAAPEFAAALGRAVDVLHSGRDATDALLLARRALAEPSAAVQRLPAWGLP